jgi:hypothetical protein
MSIQRMITVPAWSADGNIEFIGVSLPARRVVCPVCEGERKHVNPAIDGNGLSADDFAQDPDFAESYFGGTYDVRCDYCKGRGFVDEVDEDACRSRLSWWKGLLRHWNHLKLENDSRAERDAERRVGA